MELQEEKVNTTADWLADEAISWLLGSDWVKPRGGLVGFAKGCGSLSILFTRKGKYSLQCMCVCVCMCLCMCVLGGIGANFLSGEWGKGNTGRRQEVGRGSCTHCPCTALFLWQPPAGWEISRLRLIPLKWLFRKNVTHHETAERWTTMWNQKLLSLHIYLPNTMCLKI